jgi:uncharacterized protein (TIGR03663 family)
VGSPGSGSLGGGWRLNRLHVLLLAAVAGVGLVLRAPSLGERPLHNDEAVNGIKFGQLWDHAGYKYDPNEHHGPSLIYATYALARLTRAPGFDTFSEARLRWVTVLFGVGLVLLLPLISDGLGRRGTLWAAGFTAVSPAFVYYSRYYIHEMLLVFFTLLALASAWRYWRSRKLRWALTAGVALGLMDATKETFVINLGAAVLALMVNQLWNRVIDATGPPVKAPPLKTWHLAAGLAAWVVVAVLLFSSFLQNPAGPLDSFRTYLPWLNRAGGDSPHIHGWDFYAQRLLFFHAGKGPVWTEALILALAVVGAGAGFLRRELAGANASLVRFLAIYTVALSVVYTGLAYKTPWCLLGFWHTTILLAGVGAAVLLARMRTVPMQVGVAALVLAGSLHLAWQAWWLDAAYAADQRNPYVYAHTSSDILKLVAKVDALTAVVPQPADLVIKVMAPDEDYWPLPWYLRRFHHTGWWGGIPADPLAPLMLVSANLHANFDEKGTHLMVGYFQLRPDVFFELYVEKQLWTAWLAKRPAETPTTE